MKNTKRKVEQLLASEPNLSAFVTLFSFGTLARAAQFLVPLLIYSLFAPSEDLDFYFYWSTQSNLIANFLVAIWPGALMSILVKAREKHDEDIALRLAAAMLRRFLVGVLVTSGIAAILASMGLLGGPTTSAVEPIWILFCLALTISATAVSFALAEIGTAARRFGIGFIGLLIGAISQLLFLVLIPTASGLLLSFLLGTLLQFISTAWLLRHSLKTLVFEALPLEHKQELDSFLPGRRLIVLLFLGGFSTLIASHFSMRFLPISEIGLVSAFALASMLAFSPQLLILQPLSTVCGVALTEAYHRSSTEFSRINLKWRNLLFRLSLWLGVVTASLFLLAILLLPRMSEILQLSDQSLRSYTLAAVMGGFLCVPLGISGLSIWNARMTMSLEKIEIGIWYQVFNNSLLISLLLAFSSLPGPFSSPLALAVAALTYLVTLPIFQRIFLLPNRIL